MQLKVERATNEASLRIQHVEGDSSQQLSVLDSKTRALIEETRQAVVAQRTVAEGEREKQEMRMTSRMDRLYAAADARVVRARDISPPWRYSGYCFVWYGRPLTHLPLVLHIRVCELGQHWFR